MSSREHTEAGPLAEWLTEDHRRLDALLDSALADAGGIDGTAYDQFRAGLLRHIGMEEKILLPAVQRLHGEEALPVAAKLRLDHGALAALLMPTPTAAIIATIRNLLAAHNALEEGRGGWYELCDRLAAPEAERLLVDLRAAPQVNVTAHSDHPAVMKALRRALERAGLAAAF